MNFNVAGLPTFDGTDSVGNNKKIAEYINQNKFDIVAVQEDFAYNSILVSNLDGYNHKTNHSGSIPGGDGLNIFTQTMGIYNETRVQWNDSFGEDFYEYSLNNSFYFLAPRSDWKVHEPSRLAPGSFEHPIMSDTELEQSVINLRKRVGSRHGE